VARLPPLCGLGGRDCGAVDPRRRCQQARAHRVWAGGGGNHRFRLVAVFFFWTMHFLLAGRVAWRRLVRPALVTALLWVALASFSSLYFSTTVIDDSKTYGTIGVVFTFLTWFILIGSVIVLGAAVGAVWERRGGRGDFDVDSSGRRNRAEEVAHGEPAPRRKPPG